MRARSALLEKLRSPQVLQNVQHVELVHTPTLVPCAQIVPLVNTLRIAGLLRVCCVLPANFLSAMSLHAQIALLVLSNQDEGKVRVTLLVLELFRFPVPQMQRFAQSESIPVLAG